MASQVPKDPVAAPTGEGVAAEHPPEVLKGSERAVRTCSLDCPFIKNARRGQPKGCEFYQRKEVKEGQPCKYDIELINDFVIAHKNGDMDKVKSTVGGVIGSMFIKLQEMLQIIGDQGMVREEPILDGRGNPIILDDGKMAMRVVEHPLLTKVTTMAKAIGFDLAKFKLTPTTAGEVPTVQGNILLHTDGPVNLEVILAEQKEALDRFKRGQYEAEQDLDKDPVWSEMVTKKELE